MRRKRYLVDVIEKSKMSKKIRDAHISLMITRDMDERFVYIGRIETIKGIHVLLRAWGLLGGEAPSLFIYGTGSGYDDRYEYIQKQRLSKVRLMGAVPHEQVRAIMAASLALILPTQWYEGFPMVIAEAYSVGTPVIGSDIGNVADIIRDGVTGIKFQYDDPASLARAVKRIQGQPLDRGKIKKIYDTYLTEEKNYRTLIDIYATTSRRSKWKGIRT